MAKLTIAWAMKHWRQGLYPDTVRGTRRETIQAFRERYVTTPNDTFGSHDPNRPVKVILIEDSPVTRSTIGIALIAGRSSLNGGDR